MEDVHQRVERDLPALRQWVDRSLALTNGMVENVTYTEDDHLAFMALCFLCKQIDHTKSILALIPSRDVILITRSMIEGLCQLLWAARDPDALPLRWRAFAWVHDWRVMQAQIAAGELVDPERRAAIEHALRKYGDQFLTTKAREARDKGASPPVDPYHKDWRTGRQIRQIFESVEGEDLYHKLYEPSSDWQHWGAGGLAEATTRRIQRTTSAGANERYVIDGHEVLIDLNADWSVATTYLSDLGTDNHLRQTSAATGISYFLTDHLGSTSALTDVGGNVVEGISSDSFGNSAGSTRTRYDYTGRERDSATGLLYYRARFYDPELGRFMGEDPVGFNAGQMNFFAYVGNNPANSVDPTGQAR